MTKIYKLLKSVAGAAVISSVFLMLSSGTAFATHFRYGHISWKTRPDIGTNTAEITLFASFRRDGYIGTAPDGHPKTGDIIHEDIGATALNFGDGLSTGELYFLVIAYDPSANWLYTKALASQTNVGLPIIHSYNGPGPWTADINTCCRISNSINDGDGSYRVLTTITFAVETNSPVSTLQTIVNCSTTIATCTFTVPAADADGDALLWRLATNAESGLTAQPASLAITSTTGLATWPTTGRVLGLYSAQFVVEAHNPSTNVLKSQVGVDFLINLGTGTITATPPVFTQAVPTCGTTFDTVSGKVLSFNIRAQSNNAGDTATLNALGLPAGATMTPALPATANPITSTFNWTPTTTQGGPNVILFVATDTGTRQTQCSIIIDVKVDSDGDGIPDDWELHGYTFNGVFVNLPTLGADPNHKDIFVQADFMTGHKPDQTVINILQSAFASVPNSMFAVPNPDGKPGISLHVVVANELTHTDDLGTNNNGSYNWTAFDAMKLTHFPTELALSHHYMIFAHNGPRTQQGNINSGISRTIPGSDFIVTLGSWPRGTVLTIPFGEGGTDNEQAGTFMHELGHTLGLCHGGPFDLSVPDGQCNVNNKPNYLSIMNYSFQLDGLRKGGSNGVYDYSRFDSIPQLDELHLDERVGLNGGSTLNGYGTTWFCGSQHWTNNANGPTNWNCNTDLLFRDIIESDVVDNVNGHGDRFLNSYNDWRHLNFKGGIIGAGLVSPQPTTTIVNELDVQTAQASLPPPPAGLAVRASQGVIRLSWIPSGKLGDWSYKIYRNISGGAFQLIATTDSPLYQDNNLQAGTTYGYYVTAVNSLGTGSAPSNTVTAQSL